MFSDFSSKKIGNVKYSNIYALQNDLIIGGHRTSPKSNLVKSVDIRALSLYIKLLEMKMIYVNNLKLILSNDVFHEEERQADIDFLNKNILTIDKYLKNVLLKLRLRVDKEFRSIKRSRGYQEELRESTGQTNGGGHERAGDQQAGLDQTRADRHPRLPREKTGEEDPQGCRR